MLFDFTFATGALPRSTPATRLPYTCARRLPNNFFQLGGFQDNRPRNSRQIKAK